MKPNNPARKLRDVLRMLQDAEQVAKSIHGGYVLLRLRDGFHGPRDKCPTGMCVQFGRCARRDDELLAWSYLPKDRRELLIQVTEHFLKAVRGEADNA